MKSPAIYILANQRNGTLYTGVTSDLVGRTYKHKANITKGFAHRYRCKSLVYYELHETMPLAIAREKQLKAGSRSQKIRLIENLNPQWNDLYNDICS